MIQVENDYLKIEVNENGAELWSAAGKKTGTSYLWYGDPAYWGRRSPVLFPFVGAVNNKVYRYRGIEYPMGQHGFARDRRFRVLSADAESAWFELCSDEESRSLSL